LNLTDSKLFSSNISKSKGFETSNEIKKWSKVVYKLGILRIWSALFLTTNLAVVWIQEYRKTLIRIVLTRVLLCWKLRSLSVYILEFKGC
jgi:hypothetical protein